MDQPAIVIRPAALGDLAAITEIYAEAVRTGTASFEIEPPAREEMERRMAALVDNGFPYLVAERGETVLGYAYAGPYRPRPAYRFTVENSVYVSREARRLGLGSALLAALIDDATARGFRQMVAVIGDSGNEASVGIHASHGFRHVGTFENVGRKHGRWLDTVLMQLTLGDGAEAPPLDEA